MQFGSTLMVVLVDKRFYTEEHDHGVTPAKAGRVVDRAGIFDLDHTFYYDFEADIFRDALNRMQDQLSRKDKHIMAISKELDLFHKLYAWSKPMFFAKDVDLDSLLKDVEEGRMINYDVSTITMHELWNKNQALENKLNKLYEENKKLQCINDQLEERLESSGIGIALKMDCVKNE